MRQLAVPLLLVFLTVAACGASEKGESCDDEGKSIGCEDNLVCAKEKSGGGGNLVCLQTCVGQEDCPAAENCNGVGPGGRLKACQAK